MEKHIRPYDKEYMRMAMLKHEETFKLQVYELHRLYRIQKLLMKTIGRSPLDLAGQIDRTDRKSRQEIVDLGRLAKGSNAESEGTAGDSETIEESRIELSLGPSNYSGSATRPKKGDTRLTSSSFSNSSSTGSSDNIINSSKLGSLLGAGNIVKEEQLQESERLDHPPWIFQALSLNPTRR